METALENIKKEFEQQNNEKETLIQVNIFFFIQISEGENIKIDLLMILITNFSFFPLLIFLNVTLFLIDIAKRNS